VRSGFVTAALAYINISIGRIKRDRALVLGPDADPDAPAGAGPSGPPSDENSCVYKYTQEGV
jgi:hypothetical protein